jgi:hypothetical protein
MDSLNILLPIRGFRSSLKLQLIFYIRGKTLSWESLPFCGLKKLKVSLKCLSSFRLFLKTNSARICSLKLWVKSPQLKLIANSGRMI